MTILIPAYEPDARMITLLDELRALFDGRIIVVNDGSGPDRDPLFEEARKRGCVVLAHDGNRGKGAALKTGIAYLIEHGEDEGLVSADCDGQHAPADILRIAGRVKEGDADIVTGARQFSKGVPLRSRVGNSITRVVFRFATGIASKDTQTGLRGFKAKTLPFLLTITGDRFDYEMNVLLMAHAQGLKVSEIDIETIYVEEHKSHFKTIRDAALVYRPILKFCASSIVSGVLDIGLLTLLNHVTDNLFIAVVGARLVSSICNYTLNRVIVFTTGRRRGVVSSLWRYIALAAVMLTFNYLIMHLLYDIAGLPLMVAKVLTETVLYLFSYWSQRRFVFFSND